MTAMKLLKTNPSTAPKKCAATANYTVGEEIANAVTHGVATLLSIAGLCVLVAFAASYSGSALVVTAVAIFGASMVCLYTASTLYHAIPNIRAKKVLQVLDHAMIYILIAGSYTPFCLVTLKGWVGITLCCAVWAIAIAGVSLQKILLKRSDWINCLLYLVMGVARGARD